MCLSILLGYGYPLILEHLMKYSSIYHYRTILDIIVGDYGRLMEQQCLFWSVASVCYRHPWSAGLP